MNDLDKTILFCSKLKNNPKCSNKFNNDSSSNYPSSLKSLTGISKETKSTLLKVIKEYQSTSDPNDAAYVEAELIRRFLNPSKFLSKNIKTVDGPISFYQMSHPTIPQVFYLFGDMHVRGGGCSDKYLITEWIKDTIVNSPVFIDVYVEINYSYKNYPTQSKEYTNSISLSNPYTVSSNNYESGDYLGDMWSFSEKCFKKFKDDVMCQTSRFHYTDLRSIFETEEQLRGFETLESHVQQSDEYNKIWLDEFKDTYIDDVNSYLKFLGNKDSFLYKKIRKQFSKIKDKKIRRILEQSFDLCIKRNEKALKLIESSWSITPKFMERKRLSKYFPLKYMTVLRYGTCLMDHYLMARCFRTFNKIKKEYNRPSYNNIIYSGDAHTNNYIDILKKIGYIIDYQKINMNREVNDKTVISNFQCLVFDKDFKQPMFQQRYK
jgi:hypothetical protein